MLLLEQRPSPLPRLTMVVQGESKGHMAGFAHGLPLSRIYSRLGCITNPSTAHCFFSSIHSCACTSRCSQSARLIHAQYIMMNFPPLPAASIDPDHRISFGTQMKGCACRSFGGDLHVMSMQVRSFAPWCPVLYPPFMCVHCTLAPHTIYSSLRPYTVPCAPLDASGPCIIWAWHRLQALRHLCLISLLPVQSLFSRPVRIIVRFSQSPCRVLYSGWCALELSQRTHRCVKIVTPCLCDTAGAWHRRLHPPLQAGRPRSCSSITLARWRSPRLAFHAEQIMMHTRRAEYPLFKLIASTPLAQRFVLSKAGDGGVSLSG